MTVFFQSGLLLRFRVAAYISRREIEQLGSSFGSSLLLFHFKVAGAEGRYWPGEILGPQ